MYHYHKTQVFPYDPTKLAIRSILRPKDDFVSNCGHNFKMIVCSDDIMFFNDKEDIVTYVDFHCGNTFQPETNTKIAQIS